MLSLPGRTLGLVGRFWVPLLFWFTAGYLAHDLVLRGAALLALHNKWLGFAGLSISVLIMLASTIMMLHAVRPGLTPFGGVRRQPRPRPVQEQPRVETSPPIVDAIAETILPFLVFYGAWGLFVDEVRTWGTHAINQSLDAGLNAVDITESATGIPLLIALGSWLIRAGLETLYNRRGGRVLGLSTALFEANWMFFAVISVSAIVANAYDWIAQRMLWETLRETVVAVVPDLTWFANAWAALQPSFPTVKDGLLQPLLWLTIAAVVFGEKMDRDADVIANSRFQSVGRAFERLPRPVQRVTELFSREVRDKWTPLANGVRFVLTAGPIFYLTYCLCYMVIDAGTEWLEVLAVRVVGPHPFDWWWPWLTPLHFVQQGLHEILRIALLAAAFELGLERARRRRLRLSGGTPPAASPPPPTAPLVASPPPR